MRHGIQREVYGVPLAENWREYLLGEDDNAILKCPTVKEIADACIERWMLPRSQQCAQLRSWKREDIWRLITEVVSTKGEGMV